MANLSTSIAQRDLHLPLRLTFTRMSTMLFYTKIITAALWLVLLVSTAATQAGTELYFVLGDHLGTAKVITNQDQDVVWQTDYSPFGEVVDNSNETEFRQRFPGQYQDDESGFYYNYYRDYDPSTGRYIQSDPIGLAGGLNTYAYVGGNPLSYVDPTGEAAVLAYPALALAAGGSATACVGTNCGQAVANVASNVSSSSWWMAYLLYGAASINSAGPGWSALSSTGGSSSSSGVGLSGGSNGDYCLLNPHDPICKNNFNPNQCPGTSKKNLKHINKHLGQFQKLNPNFTLQQQVNLGQRIASNPQNYIGSSGGRAAYQANITISGQTVPVRVVVNSVNNIRTIYIPGP